MREGMTSKRMKRIGILIDRMHFSRIRLKTKKSKNTPGSKVPIPPNMLKTTSSLGIKPRLF